MEFRDYLNTRTANIKVKNLTIANELCEINGTTLNETNIEAKCVKNYHNVEIPNIYNLFKSYLNLGKKLYSYNNDKIIKFRIINNNTYELSFETFLVTKNNYDEKSYEELRTWLLNNNYCLEEDKDLIGKHFIETDCLIDLSIFSYLITESLKNIYQSSSKKKKNYISFDTFIKYESNIPKNYLSDISFLISEFEKKKVKYLREESNIFYNQKLGIIEIYRVYENIYSLLWHILKLYLSFISINGINDNYFENTCKCGNTCKGRKKLCETCDRKHATLRRELNRENEKNLKRIEFLLKYNSFDETITEKAKNILKLKRSYKNNSIIKSILLELEEQIKETNKN